MLCALVQHQGVSYRRWISSLGQTLSVLLQLMWTSWSGLAAADGRVRDASCDSFFVLDNKDQNSFEITGQGM